MRDALMGAGGKAVCYRGRAELAAEVSKRSRLYATAARGRAAFPIAISSSIFLSASRA